MLKFSLLVAVLMVQMAFAQQRVAVLNTEDDGEPLLNTNELSVLTDNVMATQSIQRIGNQVWMAENLNVDVAGSKCYDNEPANCVKYGRLYTWAAAKTACPSGWHLPTKEEWDKMTEYIGGEDTEGKFLKATSGWSRNGNGTDKFGFAALPGGSGYSSKFTGIGIFSRWWSATEYDVSNALYRSMDYDDAAFDWDYDYKMYLFSVRCLQD